jgi:hypothetical protein
MCSQSQNVVNSIVQQFFPIFLKNEGKLYQLPSPHT